MEVKEYLRHDYKARTHPRLQRIMMKYGMEGVGLYWCLIEMMYEQEGELLLSECETYAFALRMDAERIATFIRDSGAFEIDGDSIYSTTVTERLLERDEKSKKASKSAQARWNKHKEANTMRTHTKRNASIVENSIEEDSKVEEEKRKRFTPPTVDEVFELMNDRNKSEYFVNYYQSNGWKVGKTPMKDWRATVRNWQLKDKEKSQPKTRDTSHLYGDTL